VILGCGVDLMEVARFEREVARRGDGLTQELFSASELGWCRRRRRAVEGYAMVYAAKEALFKALGTGKVGRMAWSYIEIAWPAAGGRPTVTLSGETAAVAEDMGVAALHASLACTRTIAVAWVVAAGADARRESVVSSQ
jgi:holo-[acyl-carrier protein] synthase